MKTIRDFPGWFAKQKLSRRLAIGCAGLLFCFCGCIILPREERIADDTFPFPYSFPTQTLRGPDSITPVPRTPSPTFNFSTSTATSGGALIIVSVNKSAEYVDIQNVGGELVFLDGWVLVSERDNQTCGLGGLIKPGDTLRIWAGSGSPGFSCGYSGNIWNNNELDPAVLYNAQGQEVSRYP